MAEQLHRRPVLLRWWRTEQSEFSLEELARAAGVSPATVHNWETDQTDGPSLQQLTVLDDRLRASEVLNGLYVALRTPDALDATPKWRRNFQGESRPCWAWLRVAGTQPGAARIDAGPFRLDCEVPAGEGGLVQAYAFASNPAVTIQLDRAGWVDFGYGTLPADIGADIIDAVEFAVIGPRNSPDHALVEAGRWWLPTHEELGGPTRWFDTVRRSFGHRVEVAWHTVSTAMKAMVSTGVDVSSADASRDAVTQHWGGDRYRRLRVARGHQPVRPCPAGLRAGPGPPRHHQGSSPSAGARVRAPRAAVGRTPRHGARRRRPHLHRRGDNRAVPAMTHTSVAPCPGRTACGPSRHSRCPNRSTPGRRFEQQVASYPGSRDDRALARRRRARRQHGRGTI